MSNKPAKSARNSAEVRGRPFDPAVIEQAQALAARYHIKVKQDHNGYVGTVTDLPTIFGFGPTKEAALSTARDHLKWGLAYLIETGRTPSPKAV